MAVQTSITPLSRPTPTRLRGGRIGSLEAALLFVSVFAVLAGLLQITAGLTNSGYLWALVLFTLEFWIWVAAGVLASWRRPGNATGALLIVGGIAVLLAGVGNIGLPALEVVSAIFATSVLAVAVHVLLAFPSGRLRGTIPVVITVTAYVVAVGLSFTAVLVSAGSDESGAVVTMIRQWIGPWVTVAAGVVLARRLAATDREHRRVLLPLCLYGIVAVIAFPLAPNVLSPLGASVEVIFVVQFVVSSGLPIAFLAGVLQGGFSRTTPLEALSAWLAVGGAARPAVARALANTLGDTTLRVEYWDVNTGSYLDEDGTALERQGPDADRGRLEVRVESHLIGAIDYDVRMVADPGQVRRAGEVLAIAIDRERLTAQLLAANEQLVQSRIRLVEAADRERSRIARDLHDGLQMQLVLLAIEAQSVADSPGASSETAESAETLRRGIDRAASDLRRLVHDVLPAALLERGLVAAAEDLVDRLEVRASLHSDVDEGSIGAAIAHTAYFILAEALANTVKHARASTVRVTLAQTTDRICIQVEDDGIGGARVGAGTGLRSLMDRVDALQGVSRIVSAPGAGTRIEVELPRG